MATRSHSRPVGGTLERARSARAREFAKDRRRPRLLVALFATLALLGAGVVGAVAAQATVDYTQGVAPLDASHAKVWFTPAVPSTLVDLHYTFLGQSEQDFRMTNNGGAWEHAIIQPLAAGTVVTYWFTYNKNGANQGDTPHFTYTHGAGGCTANCGGGGPGTFPLVMRNNTRGTWTDSQVYLTIIGQGTPGQWSYLKPDGTWTHINHLDAAAPGHLTKNSVNYPNMSFTIAQAGTVTIPTYTLGGRIYVSIGSPLFIPVSPDDQGWGGPDLRNPSDPNADVYFDWYEYTYVFNQIPYGGNTTQVDQFSFPMTAHLVQASSGYDSTLGMTQTRAQVFAGYQSFVGPAFRGLANQYRIVAPRTSNDFQPSGPQGSYLQAYIDQVWAKFTAQPWSETFNGRSYHGQIAGGVLTGTRDDGAQFHVSKPTTTQVFECSGPLALGDNQGGDEATREVGRDFCAAFHRGVALNPADWYTAAKYYQTSPRDDYAAYLHTVSLNNRAYAFAYDDVNDQSSVQILPAPATPPTSLTLAIGW